MPVIGNLRYSISVSMLNINLGWFQNCSFWLLLTLNTVSLYTVYSISSINNRKRTSYFTIFQLNNFKHNLQPVLISSQGSGHGGKKNSLRKLFVIIAPPWTCFIVKLSKQWWCHNVSSDRGGSRLWVIYHLCVHQRASSTINHQQFNSSATSFPHVLSRLWLPKQKILQTNRFLKGLIMMLPFSRKFK